jgi:hypothetical protein
MLKDYSLEIQVTLAHRWQSAQRSAAKTERL